MPSHSILPEVSLCPVYPQGLPYPPASHSVARSCGGCPVLVIVTSFYTLKTPRLESYNAKDPGHKSCQDRLIKLYRHLLESQNSEYILYG